jgi:hypothetical protein
VHGFWPWAVLVALGAYHGLNPAMGWLFAVALGMQQRDRRAVVRALPFIALGHEASLVLVVLLVLGLGVIADPSALHVGAGLALVAFGVFRFIKPRAHFRWTTMRVNRRELAWWSFLMSSAHGAGLMVLPVLIGTTTAGDAAASDHALETVKQGTLSIPASALALVLHVAAMIVVMGALALLVYDRYGVSILRKAWINLDGVWAAAFIVAGVLTFIT